MKRGARWAALILMAGAGWAAADEPQADLSAALEGVETPAAFDRGWLGSGVLGRLLGDDGGPASDRFWIRKETLIWWIKDGPRTVPFGTTGPEPASGFTPLPGYLGEPGTRVVLGDRPASYGVRPGARITAGFWLDDEKTVGIEGNYLILGGPAANASVATSGRPGSPNLAVPYHDATGAAITPGFRPQGHVPGEAVWVLPGPLGGFKGILGLSQPSQLQGTELNALVPLHDEDGFRLSGLAGFRWLQLREALTFDVATRGLDGGLAPGSLFNSQDKFLAQNNFFGGQLGARAEYRSGPWSLAGTAEVALGVMHESLDITGFSRTSSGTLNYPTAGTGGQFLPGGIFAQRTNGGDHATDRFGVVPEAVLQAGYQLTKALRVSVNYTFLFAGGVARPGDQVDRRINSTLTGLADASRASGRTATPPAGPALPSFLFHESGFWAQGISFAVDCRF